MKQNDQTFRIPDRDELAQLKPRNGTQSSNNTPKKFLNKLNNISLKNFTSSLDIELSKSDKQQQQQQQQQDKTNELNNNNLINAKKRHEDQADELDNDEQANAESILKSDSTNSLDIPNSNLLWMVEPRPKNSSEYYNFTNFTFALNELSEELKKILPPTDSRFRSDIYRLELGDLDAAADEKNRLEEKQRDARKEMKKHKRTFSPLWFKLVKQSNSGKDDWRFDNKYFDRNYSDCPDIF